MNLSMYNSQYNNSTYNANPPFGITTISNDANPFPFAGVTDAILFDDYSLQNSSIVTSKINNDDLVSIEINSFKYPRENGGGVLSKYYRGREIKLEATIKSDTATNFNALLDTTKKALRKTEGYLKLLINGEYRKIKATCSKFDTKRDHYHLTFCKVEITFTALEPFFYSDTAQTYSFLAKNSSFSEEVQNDGSIDTQPIFYKVFWVGTAITSVTLSAYSRTLTINNTFAQNDILTIDAVNKVVMKNGVEIDYTGAFPIFPPGANQFTYTYTGAVLVDITLVQNKNYL